VRLAQAMVSESRWVQAERRLEESEERYQTLAGNLPLGIYRRTPGSDGKLVTVNPALVEMFGYDSASELNQVPVANLYFHPEQCEDFSSKMFKNREVIREQLEMKRKDGEPIWVAVTARVICNSQGVPTYFDGMMEDTTTQKHAEAEAKLRNRQLIHADKLVSLGVLVSGVAHEINNPTQFIVSHVGALEKTIHDALPILDRYFKEHGDFILGGQPYSRRRERIPAMFEGIREGTSRIASIVAQLRDYARERPSEQIEDVSLNDVVAGAVSLLSSMLNSSVGRFYVTYGENMPPFEGDHQRVEQVVVNLIQNACQAFEGDVAKAGEISVQTWFDEQAGRVVVQVTDTGRGISEEALPRIRDPFFTTRRGSGGTGLGLSISDTIVARHGGRLEFKSEVGAGTRARMFLPARPREE